MNTLGDLNNRLFEELERLNDTEVSGEKLSAEVMRAKAMTQLAAQIINSGNLALRAKTMQEEYGTTDPLPAMLRADE